MIQIVGCISVEQTKLINEVFSKYNLSIQFTNLDSLTNHKIISLDSLSTKALTQRKIPFYNWDLMFTTTHSNDSSDDVEKKLVERVRILKAILELKTRPVGNELHGSIRVYDLAKSACFYTWLFGIEPKEWTNRYVTFVRSDIKFNFVLLVSDGKELSKDTLYHLGMGVSSKESVIEFYHSAYSNGFNIHKPPRTTWRGTPLHELWLKDPDGTLIEIYARLTDDELREMPNDQEPIFLV